MCLLLTVLSCYGHHSLVCAICKVAGGLVPSFGGGVGGPPKPGAYSCYYCLAGSCPVRSAFVEPAGLPRVWVCRELYGEGGPSCLGPGRSTSAIRGASRGSAPLPSIDWTESCGPARVEVHKLPRPVEDIATRQGSCSADCRGLLKCKNAALQRGAVDLGCALRHGSPRPSLFESKRDFQPEGTSVKTPLVSGHTSPEL